MKTSVFIQKQAIASRERQMKVIKQPAPIQSAEQRLRRIAVSMLRELRRQWPQEYADIGREINPLDAIPDLG